MLILTLALSSSALTITAQDADGAQPRDLPPPREAGPGGGPGPDGSGAPRRMGHRPPPSPLMRVLDANGDGIIDEEEIANAPASLKKLDKNGDAKLTPNELRPPLPPPGERAPGGPSAPGEPRGPEFRTPQGEPQANDDGNLPPRRPRPPRPPQPQPPPGDQ